MMRVTLSGLSKSFGRETVIRDLSHVFEARSRTAVLGANGSGKSTLLQLVAGATIPTRGSVEHMHGGGVVEQEFVYRHVSIAAPYISLYDELSLRECVENHARFKPFRNGYGSIHVARTALLDDQLDKPVRDLSSGMKQRLKLTLAILSDTSLLLLDEPASNLDARGIQWFGDLLRSHLDGRTLLVASNRQEEETFACGTVLEMRSAS